MHFPSGPAVGVHLQLKQRASYCTRILFTIFEINQALFYEDQTNFPPVIPAAYYPGRV